MIIVLKKGAPEQEIQLLTQNIEHQGVSVSPVRGTDLTILGLVGDTSKIDVSQLEANHFVDRIMRVLEPFKKANRMFHPGNTEFHICGHPIGGEKLAVIAGPCSVESAEQITNIAKAVKASGAQFLRGGAFKPRTSPYAFQAPGY